MNPERFYMPGYMRFGNVPIRGSMLSMANSTQRGAGLFSKITNGIRSVNWGGLLSNANKTLNVVNQAIPLVRQAGPMINNVRSMLRIAKAFGSETTVSNSNRKNNSNNKVVNNNTLDDTSDDKKLAEKKEVVNDNYPNFFV